MKFMCLCLLGIAVLVELLLPTVANSDDFLNINCGASGNETGGDGLEWVSDSSYTKVKTRKSYYNQNTDLYLPYRSISYFTNLSQNKYCYLLPVKSGIRYIVRTQFAYSFFQSQVRLASVFDLLIGGTMWTKINLPINNNNHIPYTEIILAAKSDLLNLCLARNSQTESDRYVFISTIELRPLDSSMYKTKNALVTIARRNFGGAGIYYRQDKSDQYDRYWDPLQDYRFDVNTTNDLPTELPNKVPQTVLQTAVSAKQFEKLNISAAFVPHYVPISPGSYYFSFYFCNIDAQTPTRFQVLINVGNTDWIEFQDNLQCKFLDYNLELGTNDTRIEVFLSKFSDSLYGPFINGAELYKIVGVQSTHLEDVFAIREIAESGNFPDDWSGADPCLPSEYSSTGITCSKEDPPRVIIINLTNMGLAGDIPPIIAKLTALTQLRLGNNSLSGPVPDLSPLKSLTTLQLQNNQLEGSIPTSLEKLSALNQLYLQNNSLIGSVPRGLVKHGLDLRVDPQIKFPAHKTKRWSMGISVGCSVLLVLVVICTAFIWRHRHRSQPYTTDFPTPSAEHVSADIEDQIEYPRLAIEYTEEEIKAATKNYSTIIGKGSFGSVFYGRLSSSDVAVKVLSADSNQGQLEFHNELTLLSRIHHRNLVNLVGYCRQPVVALVYEYMECGSLKDHLYGIAKLEKPLDWQTRLNIAVQAAEGLLYLHDGCNPRILHRDIKCNNILLDGNMCAKVADFGLSKLVETSKSYVSTDVKGTLGYMDPQYFETSALTEKSDVYSFGVVLLEILSGIPSRDGIVESGRKLLSSGRLVDLIDPSLGARYNLPSAWRVAEIAYGCTEPKSIDRPKMNVVVKELQEASALPEEDVNLYGNFSIATSVQGDLPSLR